MRHDDLLRPLGRRSKRVMLIVPHWQMSDVQQE